MLGIIRCKSNPPMGVTTYVTLSESLASVLISKSTCGIFMLFIAFGIACNHHFNSFVAKESLTQALAFLLDVEARTCSCLSYLSFSNRSSIFISMKSLLSAVSENCFSLRFCCLFWF